MKRAERRGRLRGP
uniref:Uncharacterized protein n=1 Tax=Arundo donax TaxID=35708 RepID=A0A0A8XYZ0_ARUDO